MGFDGIFMEFDGIYPMVKSHNYAKSQFTIFLEGKIHYKWLFSIAILNYQRVAKHVKFKLS